jgi:hypothetical protein
MAIATQNRAAKLNSLRYLGVLCVSAVFLRLSQTLNKLWSGEHSQAVFLECLEQPQENRGDAENAEVAQRVRCIGYDVLDLICVICGWFCWPFATTNSTEYSRLPTAAHRLGTLRRCSN